MDALSQGLSNRSAPDLISVVIPIYNAATLVGQQLDALAHQDYHGEFEVLLVDNGSSDDLRQRLPQWLGQFPRLRYVDAPERQGVSYARNAGYRASSGQALAVCDADDIVMPGWLSALAEGLERYDLVGGFRARHPATSDRAARWRSLGGLSGLPRTLGYRHYALGCNLAVWTNVIDSVGGWSEEFIAGADDIDFSWKVQEAGFHLGEAPGAIVQYRVRETLKGFARQMYFYGLMRGLLVARSTTRDLRPSPPHAVLYRWGRLVLSTPLATFSPSRRGRWVGLLAREVGRVRGSIRYRIWAM